MKINYYEYIHYTNEQTDNFIITNLTLIGGGESTFPCGSNDNDEFDSFSPVDINKFCGGNETNYKYYFFKYLSFMLFEKFYSENKLYSIDLEEYHDSFSHKIMILFSTGYFSLSEEDLKIIKKPSDININNNYNCKIVSKCYKLDFIFILVFAFSVLFFIGCYVEGERSETNGCIIPQIIINCILISICLVIIICALIQMILIKQLYMITSYIPDFLFNDEVKKIRSEKVPVIYFIGYLLVLIFQIPYFVKNINEYKKQKRAEIKTPLVIEKEKNTELSLKNQKDVTPDIPHNIPQRSDNWTRNTQY